MRMPSDLTTKRIITGSLASFSVFFTVLAIIGALVFSSAIKTRHPDVVITSSVNFGFTVTAIAGVITSTLAFYLIPWRNPSSPYDQPLKSKINLAVSA
jgi:hypothetical protein